MLFDNKITTDKGQVKAYSKAREMIDNKISESANIIVDYNQRLNESFTNRPIGRAAARRRNNARRFQAKENITKKLFMENFFDLYKKSLLLDEDFVQMQEENLYKLCEDVFNNLMNEGYISWDGIKSDSSKFIQNLYTLCEEVAEKNATMNVNQDSVNKVTVSDDAIINEKDKKKDEEVDEEDKEKIDDETKSSKKKVSNVVKDKVIDTLKKEKEAAEKEAETEEEIKEKSKTKKEKEEEDTSTEDETESETPEDDTTEDTSKEDGETTEDETKSESFSFSKLRRPNKIRNNSLFRSIQLNVSNKAIKEKSLNENVDINMDMIFAESLAYYTLLETMNTVGIINMKPSELRQLCTKLIIK